MRRPNHFISPLVRWTFLSVCLVLVSPFFTIAGRNEIRHESERVVRGDKRGYGVAARRENAHTTRSLSAMARDDSSHSRASVLSFSNSSSRSLNPHVLNFFWSS